MIVEHAIFRIKAGQEAAFEKAFPDAIPHAAGSKGFNGLEIRRSVEKPGTYHLLIRWDTVEDHMVGFRESENFQKWRAVIGSFFAEPPEVEHFHEPFATK